MAVRKPQRAPRQPKNSDHRNPIPPTLMAEVERDAQQLIAKTENVRADSDRLRDVLNALKLVLERHGDAGPGAPHNVVALDLLEELGAVTRRMVELGRGILNAVGSGETVEEVKMQLLLARGASSYQVAETVNVTSRTVRRKACELQSYLVERREQARQRLARTRADVAVPGFDINSLKSDITRWSDALNGPEAIEAEIADLDTAISMLTLDKRKAP